MAWRLRREPEASGAPSRGMLHYGGSSREAWPFFTGSADVNLLLP